MVFGFFTDPRKTRLPEPHEALPGREMSLEPTVADTHLVTGATTKPPWPDGSAVALFGLGCFWGAERRFWQTEGVLSTQVGYAAGHTPNPTYEEVCSGRTGHNEVVRVVFDPSAVTFARLCQVFFEAHDPTQGMRQGNDVGTQYRSGVYPYDEGQRATAESVRAAYGDALRAAGHAAVTTEIVDAPAFYFAEDYHQQYLAKNPNGYCGIGGTGVSCPVGLGVES